MSKADLPDMEKHIKRIGAAIKEYKKTLERQQSQEPRHLEALLLKEKEMALDDEMPLDEAQMVNIMKAHKANSPFALNVEIVRSKLFKEMSK